MCRTYVYTLCMLCFIYSFFCVKYITCIHRKGTAYKQVQFILINEYSFKNLRTGRLLYTKSTVLLSILYYDCVYPQSVCVGKVSLTEVLTLCYYYARYYALWGFKHLNFYTRICPGSVMCTRSRVVYIFLKLQQHIDMV